MVRLVSKGELVKKANSKAPVMGYSWNNVAATLLPNFSFEVVMEMVDNDPIASGAVQQFVDKCMEGDYAVIKKDNKKYDRSFEERLVYDLRFDQVLRSVFLSGKLYHNVFLELCRDPVDDSVTDINVLDSTIIQPVTKPNGDPLRYESRIPDQETGVKPSWDVKDIVWIKFNNRDGGYAPVNIKSLWTTLNQKKFINRFINWCWQTGQYRVIHNFKASDDKVVQDFIAYNSKVDSDFSKPFLTGGEYQRLMVRDMSEMGNLEAYLKYLDSQIIIALRVPPIDVGIPDASGRSNADAQNNSFAAHVHGWRLVVANSINELFKKMNRGNNALVFGPTDRFSEKSVWENVQIMRSMNVTDEACEEYLADQGLFFESKVFQEPEEPVNGSEEGLDNPRDLDQYPSRIGKGSGEANAKIGTGESGTTRDDQLVKKSFDYSKYHTYEVVVDDS